MLDRHRREPRIKPADVIRDLAYRIDRLRPDHRNPERFHEEKSEIAYEMTEIAGRIG